MPPAVQTATTAGLTEQILDSRHDRLRVIGPTMACRSKDDLAAPLPLPRWTSWALILWTIGSAAIYTVVLARWWE